MASGDTSAARRYSRALFNVARDGSAIDAVSESLALLTGQVQASPDLLKVLQHPLIPVARKKELLGHVFADAIHPDVKNFLSLLIDKDRASIIPSVAREFNRLVDEHRGVTDAEVTSAVPLTSEQTEALAAQLQRATGYTVRLQSRVDEDILGGLVIRVGDKLIDGSVTTQLQTIREQMKRVKVT